MNNKAAEHQSANNVLQAREKRAETISQLLKTNNTIISLKANLPTGFKNHWTSEFLVKQFAFIVKNKVPFSDNRQNNLVEQSKSEKCLDGQFLFGEDGTSFLFIANCSGKRAKAIAKKIEEKHPLGRLIDIDVYDKAGKQSRTKLRKCYLCDQSAAVCIRQKTHSAQELALFAQEKITNYVALVAAKCMEQAVQKELCLPNKFGAVDKKSCGSHTDMNYALMKKSANAIFPHLVNMLKLGLNEETVEIDALTSCGLQAEKDMLLTTGGINTYKGLIFSLGLAAVSVGQALRQGKDMRVVFDMSANLAKQKLGEIDSANTVGATAAREGKQSARQQAALGMPAVQNALQSLRSKKLNKANLTIVLAQIISKIDDTVLVKRTGEKYFEYKQLISQIKTYDRKKQKRLHKEFSAQNISCGGACDLLVVTIFLRLFSQEFFI